MKKILVLLVMILFVASPLFASAVTDATKPLGHLKYSLAVEDNYIFKKDMDREGGEQLDVEDMNQIYGKFSLGLTPYFNLYAKLGGSNGGDIETIHSATQFPVKVTTNYGFLWGIGLSGAREISDGWKIGLDAQYDSWKADADKITINGKSTVNVSGAAEYFEFQATPFVTRRFEWTETKLVFNPYLGATINYLWGNAGKNLKCREGGDDYVVSWTGSGKDKVGIVVGSDVEFEKNWSLGVEGRFIDETAITVSGAYRF